MEWIRIEGISKSFGSRDLFKDISFAVQRGERVGLVGPNGVGKSTLLKCIMGYEELDGGHIIISEGCTLGYLKQDIQLGDGTLGEEIAMAWHDVQSIGEQIHRLTKQIEEREATTQDLKRLANLQERFEALGGYDYERRTKKIIYSLGFKDEDLERPVSDFSGGQKTRINMAKAIVRHPDFLILDEPTNHLDMDMLEWLEGYLTTYRGGILVVSHDRYFLDRVATTIVELNHLKAIVYKGNYTRYLQQKQEREKSQRRAYAKQQEYIKKTEAYIEKYRAGIKSKMARGRQSQLDRLERIEAVESNKTLRFTFPSPTSCAERVLMVQEVTSGYGEVDIIKNVSFLLRRGEAVALIGPNGAGKTTLLKTIMGEVEKREGLISVGERVQIGYFSQDHEELNGESTLLEEIMHDTGYSEEEARHVLGMFLFQGDSVFRLVNECSGGEKARLALLKLFLGGYNFLILDEPTNHLDIPTREIVEEALIQFKGTYLVISHDRYFIDKIAQRTFYLQSGQKEEYLGNYSYYREKVLEKQALLALQEDGDKEFIKRRETESRHRKIDVILTTKDSEAIDTNKKVKEKSNKINEYMREKRLAEVEQSIGRLEATIKMYQIQIEEASIAGDSDRLQGLSQDLAKTQSELEVAYDTWEQLENN